MRLQKRQLFLDSGSFTPPSRKTINTVLAVLKAQKKGTIAHPLAKHLPGRRAADALRQARSTIAACTKVKHEAVVCTAGATEANARAVSLALERAHKQGRAWSDMHVVTTGDEHPSLYDALSRFAPHGVRYTKVGQTGEVVTSEMLQKALRPETVLLSVALVVSTHGLLRNLSEIARQCKASQPSLLVHTDATQAAAYYTIAPTTLVADMVTIDSAKVFGPQGAGALLGADPSLVRHTDAMALRQGTPSVALQCGFAVALKEAEEKKAERVKKLRTLQKQLILLLQEQFPDALLFGVGKTVATVSEKELLSLAPHLTYIAFPNIHHAYLSILLDAEGIAVSTATACAGVRGDALRIGLLPTTRRRDIQRCIQTLQRLLPIAQQYKKQ